MSKDETDDLERLGYFLPEDGQHRLKKLRGHMEFLSHLVQPRSLEGEPDGMPEVGAGEMAACLELLAEQAALVLDEVSWPARREDARDSVERDDEAESARALPAEAVEAFSFGVGMDQIDALDRLVQAISAHGDVMAAGVAAELAEGTLPQLGQAVCDAASAVRDILDQIEAQRLGRATRPRNRVREAQVEYAVEPLASTPYDRHRGIDLLPMRRCPPGHDRPSGRVRLH